MNIHQSKGFRENSLFLHIYKNLLACQCFSQCTCASYLTLCFASESFTFSWKKKRGPMIGCSSELLDDNCIRVFLYEGYLVNFEICVCFWCITCVGLRDQTRWSLLVGNGGQNGNVCGPSCNKHKIYNPHKVEEQT